jgi:hypothetical protein
MNKLVANKNCQNCLHKSCLFHGENRTPVYVSPINCWDNAYKVMTKEIARAVGQSND